MGTQWVLRSRSNLNAGFFLVMYAPESQVPQVVDLTENDDAYRSDAITSRQLAVKHGRTPAQTTGQGDCLYHAVAAEAVRIGLGPRARNLANGFWRSAASECARETSVQKLMEENPNREWRRSAKSETPASYPDYIAQPGVWGSTFDVALLARCIDRMPHEERPSVVVFSREGAHVHHPVGTDGALCAKTRKTHVSDWDMCIGIDGCHWWSTPPTPETAALKRPRHSGTVAHTSTGSSSSGRARTRDCI